MIKQLINSGKILRHTNDIVLLQLFTINYQQEQLEQQLRIHTYICIKKQLFTLLTKQITFKYYY